MLDSQSAAQEFIATLSEYDKQLLLNSLLGLDETHTSNCNVSFYSCHNLRKLLKPKRSECMQSLHFKNDQQDELIITQLKDHSFLKNSYRIEINYKNHSYDYSLISSLLDHLKQTYFMEIESYA
ncbi:hypothetical protein [Enterococcus sp. AZ072]|uniref:hypothetical protein n=1 Tax=unclassified Enterococcus TaxID=2608891 RepID=UPI003D2DA1E7